MSNGKQSGKEPEFEFDPMKSLNHVLESVSRFVDQGINAVTESFNTVAGAYALPVDIVETDTAVIVKAGPLVGVQPDQIDVSITGDVLTIKGEISADEPDEQATVIRRERKTGAFSRAVKIPRPVKGDQAAADFKAGILTITLPKIEGASPRIINITSVEE
jgi:HSP20 family protein